MKPALSNLCQWRAVCAVDDIPIRGARVIHRPAEDNIAVFRTGDNTIFAIVDRCPHKGGPLSTGLVHGHAVTCPLHNWIIHLDTGHAREPDTGCVTTVPSKTENGTIYLALEPQKGSGLISP